MKDSTSNPIRTQIPAIADYNTVSDMNVSDDRNAADFAFAMNVGVVPDLYSQ